MAFVQKAPPRGRCSSDAGSVRGVRPPTPAPAPASSAAPADQAAMAYVPVRMTIAPDGSQLFSLPDPVYSPAVSAPERPGPAPEIDAELDLWAMPPASPRTSIASPTLNPLSGAEEAYSSVSEIFSPSGLSASEHEVAISDSEVVVDGFALDGDGHGDGPGPGTDGWARWAAARAAWAEAQAAAAQARRPSVVSLASSVSEQGRSYMRSKAQRSLRSDPPASTPRGNDDMATTWSWTNISEPASEAPATVSMAPALNEASARGLVILDELDMFDDEMQATRRGTPVTNTAAATPTEAWTPHTIETLSSLLPRDGERSGAVTPRRMRSVAPSRTPSLLHLTQGSQSLSRASMATAHSLRTQTDPAASPEGVDALLAGAPGAQSAGLHKPRPRGMKRVRGPRQGNERDSDVWSRLHGDYGRFTPAAYSSDSDASVEAVRSSKRSNASVSTTQRQRLAPRPHGHTHNASDWSTRPVASSVRAREPPGRPAAPAPAPARQEGLVGTLLRKVFAVDEDILNAFYAAETGGPPPSHEQTPLRIGRQPKLKFGYGENDPDASDFTLAQDEHIVTPPSPPATPVSKVPFPSSASEEEVTVTPTATATATTTVEENLPPLPLLGELESLAAASRARRTPSPVLPHALPRRARSLPYGRMPHVPSLEPSTGEALQALLGSVGAQFQSQVGRHLLFLSFARGWLTRARPREDAPHSPHAPLAPPGHKEGLTRSRSLSDSSMDTVARYQLGE